MFFCPKCNFNLDISKTIPSNVDSLVVEDPEQFIDLAIDNMKIDNLNFIKIDTQGYNYEIIKGCENLLDVFSPIILIELWNFDIYKQQYNFGEIISLLKNKGYIMLDIEKSHQWNFEGDFTNFSRSKKISDVSYSSFLNSNPIPYS